MTYTHKVKSVLKRTLTCGCAAVFAAMSAVLPCAAEEEAAEASDGYGKAGIVWMIKDYWDHRNTIELPPYNEMETDVISCTHTDVNITGNGQYEVALEGYHVEDDQIPFVEVGTLGVQFDLDFDTYTDLTLTLDECTIDGVTYTFDEQPEVEDSELGKVMKIKNAYGKNATTTPEMDAKPWTTSDPITVKFTISGLDSDKIADNPDEKIVTVYGTGSVDSDSADSNSADSEAVTDNDGIDSVADADVNPTVSQAAETENESNDSWVIYVCIAGGIIVIVVVVALIAKKKS